MKLSEAIRLGAISTKPYQGNLSTTMYRFYEGDVATCALGAAMFALGFDHLLRGCRVPRVEEKQDVFTRYIETMLEEFPLLQTKTFLIWRADEPDLMGGKLQRRPITFSLEDLIPSLNDGRQDPWTREEIANLVEEIENGWELKHLWLTGMNSTAVFYVNGDSSPTRLRQVVAERVRLRTEPLPTPHSSPSPEEDREFREPISVPQG